MRLGWNSEPKSQKTAESTTHSPNTLSQKLVAPDRLCQALERGRVPERRLWKVLASLQRRTRLDQVFQIRGPQWCKRARLHNRHKTLGGGVGVAGRHGFDVAWGKDDAKSLELSEAGCGDANYAVTKYCTQTDGSHSEDTCLCVATPEAIKKPVVMQHPL